MDQEAPSNGEATILEVRDLWKVFGQAGQTLPDDLRNASKNDIQDQTGLVVGLRNINFKINKGEFFVLMGLSGSGKSTLIRCLLRLIEPSEGSVVIQGQDVCQLDDKALRELRRRTTGMVFQNYGLLPHYTVMENAAYGLKIRGDDKEERLRRAQKALDTVGLSGWEDYKPTSLSGGMQQRVGLARALAHEPDILLMDEPFSGLDPLIRRQMQDELAELQSKLHKTIIFVTHDLHEALTLGDRIAIMRDGEVIQLDTPEGIITNPADEYVTEFVQDADPAKVLTAGSIMEPAKLILHSDEGADEAVDKLDDADQDYAFVVNGGDSFAGITTAARLARLAKTTGGTAGQAIRPEHPICDLEMLLEEVVPLAASTRYPIPVVDQSGTFLGEIRNRTILRSLLPAEVD